jgi:hypothetical protein
LKSRRAPSTPRSPTVTSNGRCRGESPPSAPDPSLPGPLRNVIGTPLWRNATGSDGAASPQTKNAARLGSSRRRKDFETARTEDDWDSKGIPTPCQAQSQPQDAPRVGPAYQDAEKPVFGQAAQKGSDARRRHPSSGWVPAEARDVLTGTSQRRGSAPTQQMGLFQQPEARYRSSAPTSASDGRSRKTPNSAPREGSIPRTNR